MLGFTGVLTDLGGSGGLLSLVMFFPIKSKYAIINLLKVAFLHFDYLGEFLNQKYGKVKNKKKLFANVLLVLLFDFITTDNF